MESKYTAANLILRWIVGTDSNDRSYRLLSRETFHLLQKLIISHPEFLSAQIQTRDPVFPTSHGSPASSSFPFSISILFLLYNGVRGTASPAKAPMSPPLPLPLPPIACRRKGARI